MITRFNKAFFAPLTLNEQHCGSDRSVKAECDTFWIVEALGEGVEDAMPEFAELERAIGSAYLDAICGEESDSADQPKVNPSQSGMRPGWASWGLEAK